MLVNTVNREKLSMATWQVQDAKARFSEFLDATIKKGPQIVTRRGVETAVLVPIEEWNRLQKSARPSLKELLLGPGPRFDNLVPRRRRKLRRRPVVEFE
jgi:antitoxin Phd